LFLISNNQTYNDYQEQPNKKQIKVQSRGLRLKYRLIENAQNRKIQQYQKDNKYNDQPAASIVGHRLVMVEK